jgi:glutaredoxin
MSVILYSNGCPKCKILKQRLDEKKIAYLESNDTSFLEENKILSFPALAVDSKIYKFYNAILWLKNQKMEESHHE